MEEETLSLTHQPQALRQQQQARLVLERWHVQLLLGSMQSANLSGFMQTLLLLWSIGMSGVENALLLGPVRAALLKMVSLPGRLAHVEWRVTAPEGVQGSVFDQMAPFIGTPEMTYFVENICDDAQEAAAVVRVERMPKAWMELREACVCFAHAVLRLNACRTAGKSAWGVQGGESGAGYQAVLRQQLASALEALVASSRVHCELQQQLSECG
jgi:hypothetical protein